MASKGWGRCQGWKRCGKLWETLARYGNEELTRAKRWQGQGFGNGGMDRWKCTGTKKTWNGVEEGRVEKKERRSENQRGVDKVRSCVFVTHRYQVCFWRGELCQRAVDCVKKVGSAGVIRTSQVETKATV